MRGKDIMDFLIIPVVVVVLVVAGYFVNHKSDAVDSPAEQVIEAVLESQGVEIDFSAEAKKELAKKDGSGKVDSVNQSKD